MRQTAILLTALYVLSTSLYGQAKKGTITGTVFIEVKIPAEKAIISLIKYTDSSVLKVLLPASGGAFSFEAIEPAVYIIGVSQVGYKKFLSDTFSINESHWQVTLPAIILVAEPKILENIKLESRKPFIERKSDRFIVNVESSITAAGSTVLNVLEQSPGISVNEENGIALKGKQGVIFLIDGKQTPLAGADLINYLKSIPASQVEKIEIITNPSSKYDAAGNAGIINIKFKKDQRQGFNGSLLLSWGQGVYSKPSAGTNGNFRKKKWNLFGNYSIAKPKGFTDFYINRRFYNAQGNTESVFDQNSFIRQPATSHIYKLGADFYAGKKTVIGAFFNGSVFNNSRDGISSSVISNPDGSLQYSTVTDNGLDGKNNNAFGNFNFKHSFDSTGRELTADIDFGKYNSTIFQDFTNRYLDDNGNFSKEDRLNIKQRGEITIQSIKADYIHPLERNAKIEAGVKSSFVKTDSDIKFFTVKGDTIEPDLSQSNHFVYEETINAAYLNYTKQFKNTELQAGLRLEHTLTHGQQITTGEKFSRNYLLLFPTFSISQQLSDKHQLSFSFSRRIDRPSYRQLNPFKVFVDPYTYVVGEPSLRPVLSNSLELSYTLLSKYIATLSYVRSRAAITDIFTQDDVTKISYQSPANLQNYTQYAVQLTIPVSIRKWMSANLISSLYLNKYSSALQGGNLQNDYTSWDVNGTSNFILGKKGWTAELSGFYQSKNAWGLFLIKDLAQVSAGIQKTTTGKKSTFKLSFADIFQTNHIAVIVKYQNMDFHTDRTWDSQTVTLSYTYRFGKTSVTRARQRNSGIEDVKSRAN